MIADTGPAYVWRKGGGGDQGRAGCVLKTTCALIKPSSVQAATNTTGRPVTKQDVKNAYRN